MVDLSQVITNKNARSIWKRLAKSLVPVANDQDIINISPSIDSIVRDLNSNRYIPDVGLGYLGFPKNNGCTRFVPILTKEDMTVYYLLVLSLQNYLVKNLDGVYGAWRIVPEKVREALEEVAEDSIIEPYYSETLSKRAWFKNWNQLNDLIEATCADSSVGNFVIISDIANFYDTIDIGRLTSDIRSEVNGENDIISLLDHFLRYWDRRLKGYSPSSKGIPQEIISDASRLLANYYLNSFDLKFKDHCDKNSITYIRWADDIFIFGKSHKQLEDSIHSASRILMGLGLNLSAAKTKKFSKKEFLQYRCIPLLKTIKDNNGIAFIRELKKLNIYSQSHEVRLDTAIKASINIMVKNKSARTPYSLNFLSECLSNYEYFSTLSEVQIFKKYKIFSTDIKKEFSKDLKKVISKPYASPRATFILLIRKYRKQLIILGLSNKILNNALDKIESSSGNSDLIKEICIPSAK